jgi:hypothetical protein
LRNDGVFLLRLVAANAGDLITTDLVYQLWLSFLQEEATKAQVSETHIFNAKNIISDTPGTYRSNSIKIR